VKTASLVKGLEGLAAESKNMVKLMSQAEDLGVYTTETSDGKVVLKESSDVDADVITTIDKSGGSLVQEGDQTVNQKTISDDIKQGDLQETEETAEEIESDGSIKEQPGSKGAWNKELNKTPLKPNAVYDVDGTRYYTDAEGKVTKVTVDKLELQARESNQYQQSVKCKKVKDGLPGDDGGHLKGSQFDGAGEQINFVPMNRTINQSGGTWYQMESEWAKTLRANGEVTNVEMKIMYGTNKRPVGFEVTADVNGTPKTYNHIN
jgi:hypothetical protein